MTRGEFLLPVCLCCVLHGSTHLAWIRERRIVQSSVHLTVDRWVSGPSPLPGEIVLFSNRRSGPPPPPYPALPQPYLAVLRGELGAWSEVAALHGDRALKVDDLNTKLSVAGSVLIGHVDVPQDVPVSVTMTRVEGGPVHLAPVRGGSFEFLGLPSGAYSLKAEAQGYRQTRESMVKLDHPCLEVQVAMERYGWKEWAGEQIAPAVSLVKAAWMLAGEYIAPQVR